MSTKADLAKLETKIADSKAEIIKWNLGFFIGLAGLIIACFKYIH
jgi:hypothetical protein